MMEHYTCMVHLLARSGYLEQALEFIEKKMPVKPDAKLLTALLSSCYFHKNVELAKSVGKRLLELEPREAGVYPILSNFYGQIGDLEVLVGEPTKKFDISLSEPQCGLWILDPIKSFTVRQAWRRERRSIVVFRVSIMKKFVVDPNKGKLQHYQNEEAIFGVYSLIFWTLTLMPLLKWTFALYSLLCRHVKFSLLPNQQAADEELSTYNYGPSSLDVVASSPLKQFLDKHKKLRTTLLMVLFAACILGDDVLTLAILGVVTSLACIILVGLFIIVVWFKAFKFWILNTFPVTGAAYMYTSLVAAKTAVIAISEEIATTLGLSSGICPLVFVFTGEMRLKRNTLFVDVLSVKEFPRSLFFRILPKDFDVLCTHPMFGPESGRNGWNGLPLVYDKVRIGRDESRVNQCERLLNIFVQEGCRMEETSCKEHDKSAAESQFITHTVGRLGILDMAFEALKKELFEHENKDFGVTKEKPMLPLLLENGKSPPPILELLLLFQSTLVLPAVRSLFLSCCCSNQTCCCLLLATKLLLAAVRSLLLATEILLAVTTELLLAVTKELHSLCCL
ncbi:hypothetical protein GIB67_009745 [Kingdonia uniflora]|uniref:Uncharacterized protein n=1 Tax=Kingdonia uniflora TaxID=39325 RepID=A0A7J7LBE9_9MAGN|nr:hypothetical protein GIB67_009745 [Kingdonia uniflora]